MFGLPRDRARVARRIVSQKRPELFQWSSNATAHLMVCGAHGPLARWPSLAKVLPLRWAKKRYLSAVREGRLGNYLSGESPFGTRARTSVVLNSERRDIDPPPMNWSSCLPKDIPQGINLLGVDQSPSRHSRGAVAVGGGAVTGAPNGRARRRRRDWRQ
jgi:hypothetical protein